MRGERQPSPALTPPPGNMRFPLVDGVRAVAALLVLSFHVTGETGLRVRSGHAYALLTHLDIGVALFFLISGFLLYRPFVSARTAGTPRPTFRRFMRRRVFRIVPAYWFALTVLVVWPGLSQVSWTNWPLYYGFAQVYSPRHIFSGLPVAWSLCTEMAFYLLLPLYAAALATITRRRRSSAVTIEVAILALLGLASVIADHFFIAHGHAFLSRTLAGTMDWFALGMGLAVASANPASWADRLCRRLGALNLACWLAALLAFVATAYAGSVGFVSPVLYGLTAFFFLLPAVFPRSGGSPASRLLGNPVAMWLGLVSYGIYLWHRATVEELARWVHAGAAAPRTVLLFVVSVAGAALLGAFSYYVVELPFLRRKER